MTTIVILTSLPTCILVLHLPGLASTNPGTYSPRYRRNFPRLLTALNASVESTAGSEPIVIVRGVLLVRTFACHYRMLYRTPPLFISGEVEERAHAATVAERTPDNSYFFSGSFFPSTREYSFSKIQATPIKYRDILGRLLGLATPIIHCFLLF